MVKRRVLIPSIRQIGTSNIKIDRKIWALSAGKRRSKNGNIYYEYRKNRTDVKGRDTPMSRTHLIRLKQRLAKREHAEKVKAFNERMDQKQARMEYLAKKTRIVSNDYYKKSSSLASVIPFGQPILVGHHSEKSHRRHIDKIHNAMRKSVALSEQADAYEARAQAMADNTVIRSDDPDALEKLKAKGQKILYEIERIKALNKERRKTGNSLIPSFELSNRRQNLQQIKARIAMLSRVADTKYEDKEVKGIKIVHNKDLQRIQLFFPAIPSYNVRTELKRYGFKWSPYNKAWQRQLNYNGLYATKQLLSKL